MICSSCGAQNREGRKFCSQCGTPLALLCGSCGAPNEADERFCGECGAPLAAPASPTVTPSGPVPSSSAAPSAERRLVSVLFADLVGFTTLSEHRDPEEVRELLSRYFDTARELIARYGGVVEKFIGDAVMAVWGTPVAHEDDAERAVRAALELVDGIAALGIEAGAPDLRLRAGVLTGEAAVTIGAEGQGMVAGDLVNTAARLQSTAAPGTVLVGRSTYVAAKQAIAIEGAGAHTLKGKELPVEAWRATRVIAGHRGFGRAERVEAPFVGRDEELRLMKDLLHTVAREKRPRLISVMGIGGIGKSRLAWEFFKYIDGLVETIYWHEGRCPAYGEGVTFWALGEMVRMRCRISETEDARSSRHKLSNAVEEYVSDQSERGWIEPRLAHLLGLEEKPSGEREELFAAWRTFFERISDKGPTVLVFEDLQWADAGLIDFIEHVLEWARSHPILIVTLARPELMDKRPNWGAGQRNFTSIYLEPLSDEAMRELLDGLASGLPERVVDQVIKRAEGVPLYAVETVRMLLDQGRLIAHDGSYRLTGELVRLEIPDTLHSLIASRLDVLSPEERSLLQNAAVLGKTFAVEALAALTAQPPHALEPRLKDLVRRELLVLDVDPRSPERGQYGFVQSLIREVAYQTLSKRDRLVRHLNAARYFESLDDEELASVVANHYLEAYRSAPRGPEGEALAAKGREALIAAAERATSLGAHRQAQAHLEQALAVATDPADRARLWEKAAESAQLSANFEAAGDYLARAVEWHEKQGDRSATARVTARLGSVLLGTGRVDIAIDKLESALAQLTESNDPTVVELSAELARGYMLKGEYARAAERAETTLVVAEQRNLTPLIADALITKGVAMYSLGRWREGVALLLGTGSLAAKAALVEQQLRALGNLSYALALVNPTEALEAARRSLDVARKLGLREWEVFSVANALGAAISIGEWDWADMTFADTYGEDIPEVMRGELGLSDAELRALRGDQAAAEQRLKEAERLLQTSTSPQDLAMLEFSRALVALAQGSLDEAHERALSAARAEAGSQYEVLGCILAAHAALWLHDENKAGDMLRLLDESSVHGEWVECNRQTLHAGLASLEGHREQAIDLYLSAAAGWRQLGALFDLGLSQLDFATQIGSDDPDARAAADEAREIFTRLGAKPFLERLEGAVQPTSVAGS